MDSKDRKQLDLPSLAPRSTPYVEEVTPELIRSIRKRPTFLHAWNFAQQFAALDDKAVCQQLGIDNSQWTKIGNGTGNPPSDERFDRYLDIVQNEIPLIWWIERRGYDFLSLRKHRDDKDRRIAELEQQLADEQRLNARLVAAHRLVGK